MSDVGCDIHQVVQRRVGDVWETIQTVPYIAGNLNRRNYTLFGVLAGVRDDRVKPIREPRGLPSDFVSTGDDEEWIGDHSFSWLLLSEITAYDWGQRVRRSGFVHLRDYWFWNKYDRAELVDPRNWCGGVSGPSVVIVSDQEGAMLPLPPDGKGDTIGGTYVRCEWEVTAAYACRSFYTTALPGLAELAFGDPESIRLVFGFDS